MRYQRRPTRSDLGSFPHGGGSCGRPTRHGVRVACNAADDDSSVLLYGIVGDDVESIEVVVGAQVREAELGKNGYRLAVADGGRQQLQELILHMHGGATDTLNLHIPNRLKHHSRTLTQAAFRLKSACARSQHLVVCEEKRY